MLFWLRSGLYISEAVVLYIRERIIAFIQIKKEYTFFLEDIRNEISRSLPRYMVPNVINIVESFTLTLNNKIDRQLLRSSYQDSILPKTNYTQDSNVEEIISIMMECLDGEAPRRMQGDDDFFEYGGDSLDAMHLALCIEEKYNLKFGVDQIYLHRTPVKIAHSITSLKNQSRLSERTYELVDPGVFYPIDQSVQRYLFADATRIDSYNPTFRQHSYYHNNRKNIISFSYILGKTYSMIEISTALSELLRKNPILYSKIKNENRIILEEFLFEESTSFPHLSMNSRPDNIEEELRRRYEDLMLKARYDHGFLALFILAEYNDSIEIIGLLDHTISDLASVSIFKQALSNILNKVNTPHNLSFRNYCMIVNDMNTDLNSGNSYFKSLSEWSSVDKDYLLDIIEDFCLYDIIDPPLQKGSINISVYISYIVAKRICSAANIKKVVVSTIFNLRDYTRLPFEYTIGDMHNTVNFMYEYGMTLDEFTKRAQNVLQFYAKKMLYVPQLINNSKVLEHTNQYKLVKKIENAIVTSVNFIGSVNDNELNILLNGLSEIQEKLYDEKRSIYVTVAESRNKLHLFTNKKI